MKRLLINSIIVFLLSGCNPVKSVLKDRIKLDAVAKEVIKLGYCVNDTVVITKVKDSIVYKDSIVEKIVNVPCKDFDTTIGGSRINISSGVLTFTRKDSVTYKTKIVTNTVVDRAMENVLKSEINVRDSSILSLGKEIDKLDDLNKDISSDMKWWKVRFFGLIIVIVGWNVFKRWVKSKIYGPF